MSRAARRVTRATNAETDNVASNDGPKLSPRSNHGDESTASKGWLNLPVPARLEGMFASTIGKIAEAADAISKMMSISIVVACLAISPLDILDPDDS